MISAGYATADERLERISVLDCITEQIPVTLIWWVRYKAGVGNNSVPAPFVSFDFLLLSLA